MARLREACDRDVTPLVEQTRQIGESLRRAGETVGTNRGYIVRSERLYMFSDSALAVAVICYENTGVSHVGQKNIVAVLVDNNGVVSHVAVEEFADRLAEPPQVWTNGPDTYLVAVFSGPWYSQSASSRVAVYRLGVGASESKEVVSISIPERHASQQPKIAAAAAQETLFIEVSDMGTPDPAEGADRLDVKCEDPSCALARRTLKKVRVSIR